MATIPQIRTRLLEVFPERQADVLAHVVVESHDDLVTQADLHKLTGVVSDLANVVTDLAESQKELAEAQKRTEDRVEELANAQKSTELAVADLAKQVGGLANSLGGSLEDFACDLVPEILEKHWRLEVTSAEPEELDAGRGLHELDLVVRGTIDGRPVMIVCEVKSAVTAKEVERFMKVIGWLRAAHPDQDIRGLFFGYRADRKAREAILSAGAAMVFTRGVIIPAA
jgi:NTP pyrophosphatase (non-canonical NTP hydrolase)